MITYPGLINHAYNFEINNYDIFYSNGIVGKFRDMMHICRCDPHANFANYVTAMASWFDRAKVFFIEGGPYEADVVRSLKDIPYSVFIPPSTMIEKIIDHSYKVFDSIYPDMGISETYRSTFESNMSKLRTHKNAIVYNPNNPHETFDQFKQIADSLKT